MPHSITPHHRSKPSKQKLFSTFRARNAGAPTSSLTGNNNTAIDATSSGSDTEEEDNTAQEREYLDKMTDDTDRKVETVFGAGVDVWKSFGGTVYADVKESVKKKMRDEEIWGRKKKRKKTNCAQIKSPRLNHMNSDAEQAEHAADHEPDPPATPTPSEWEIFPVSTSQCEDIQTPVSFSLALQITPQTHITVSPTTTRTILPTAPPAQLPPYRPRTPIDTLFHRGSAGINPLGNLARPYRSLRPTSMSARRGEGEERPSSILDTGRGGEGSAGMGVRRVVSGSFGSFEGGGGGRFDERGYRLGMDGLGERDMEIGKEEKEEIVVVDPFKGRYWLRRR